MEAREFFVSIKSTRKTRKLRAANSSSIEVRMAKNLTEIYEKYQA